MKALLLPVVAAAAAVAFAGSARADNPWLPLAGSGPQHVTIHIQPGEVVRDPNVAVIPGVPVRLKVINASREVHSFTIPQLHVNAVVMPHSATTITFTPREAGVYRWHCDFCPAVHHSGGMGGTFYALVSG
jgi:heme/copper-type cytochrome/quinol oxidase subunit 2